MSDAVTLVELLVELAGAELSFRREADLLGVAVMVLPSGRQVLMIERVYRDGTGILLDPTAEEMEIARRGDLRQIWNSERWRLLVPEVWEWVGFGEGLENLEESEAIRAFDAAQESGEEAIPFDQALQEIEQSQKKS